MAEIRFNYGDKFTQTSDSNTGIGSTIPAGKLDVAGGTSAGSLRVSGIATLSSYQGFVNTKLSTTENLIVEAGQSGSVSGKVVIGTGQTISVSTGATTGQGGIQSLKVYETFMPPVGGTVDRPTDVKPGMVYYNKDLKTIEFWDGNFWKQVDNTTRRGRGVIMGGSLGPGSNVTSDISYIDISSKGNAKEFGNLGEAAGYLNGNNVSSSTRGLRQGGFTPSRVNTVEYITLASTGDAINFGDLTTGAEGGSGCASSTRAIRAGGFGPAHLNVIDYAEISTLGDYLDFGDLPETVYNGPDGVSNGTRGIFAGGSRGGNSGVSQIDMITISSKGNSVKFGEIIQERRNLIPCANNTRGIFMGGRFAELAGEGSFIEYITMASEGNAVFFGDLGTDRFRGAGTNNHIRGVAVGGDTNQPNGSNINVIEFITIATTGNAQDFGDAAHKYEAAVGCSDSHGGLGGF